jgi:hypothetical protein
LEVGVKRRASLLKSLTRLGRYSKSCLASFDADTKWTLSAEDTDELARTSREIVRVQLNMMKLSRELASVSSLIRGLVAGKAPSVAVPMPVDTGRSHEGNNRKVSETETGGRFAFAASVTETGAVIVRVLADTSAACHQEEYGRFETWTQAQDFATVLNQMYGIQPMEAQHIVIGAALALRSGRPTC